MNIKPLSKIVVPQTLASLHLLRSSMRRADRLSCEALHLIQLEYSPKYQIHIEYYLLFIINYPLFPHFYPNCMIISTIASITIIIVITLVTTAHPLTTLIITIPPLTTTIYLVATLINYTSTKVYCTRMGKVNHAILYYLTRPISIKTIPLSTSTA